MNREEHVGMAREFTRRADEESRNGGNELIAAEFLWGTLAHCLIGVALNQGLPHDSHGAFRRIAQHLDAAKGATSGAQALEPQNSCTPTSTTGT